MKRKWTEYWGYYIILLLCMIATVYLILKGERIWVTVHDNLEDIIPRTYLLKLTGTAFSHNVDLPILNGLDRDFFPSELKLYTWLFLLLPPFGAYVAAAYLKIALSLAGGYLLAKELGIKSTVDINLVILCSFLYAMLSTTPSYAIAFGALPLLLALLCSIYRRPVWWKYLLLFLYPTLSDFAYFGIFACGYILLFIIGYTVIYRKVPVSILAALVVFSAGNILFDYRLFYLILIEKIVMIREEMVGDNLLFKEAVWRGIEAFFKGQYHSSTVYSRVVVPVCCCYLVYSNARFILKKQFGEILRSPFNLLVSWAAFNGLVCGFNSYPPFKHLVAIIVPPLKTLALFRTVWFNPFVWMLAFSVVVLHLAHNRNLFVRLYGTAIVLAATFASICLCGELYNDIQSNFTNTVKTALGMGIDDATWEEFYSEDLFAEIKEEIGYENEKSVAFGLHPAVLYWNGIETLDGYFSFYPLEYKQEFAKLIEPVLETSEEYRHYFLDWGGRAYIFSDDVPQVNMPGMVIKPANIPIDADVFREMGGKYIFSNCEITNANELGLNCIGTWSNTRSLYTIRVYEAAL